MSSLHQMNLRLPGRKARQGIQMESTVTATLTRMVSAGAGEQEHWGLRPNWTGGSGLPERTRRNANLSFGVDLRGYPPKY